MNIDLKYSENDWYFLIWKSFTAHEKKLVIKIFLKIIKINYFLRFLEWYFGWIEKYNF